MEIWLLQTGEILPTGGDKRMMRTGFLANKLADKGHSVVWWASTFDHMSKKMLYRQDTDVQLKPGLLIKALKGMPYPRNVCVQRYIDHRIIAAKFRRLAGNMARPDLILASTPDYHLAYEAALYANSENVPFVVDVRDKWPDTFLDFAPFPPARPLIRALLAEDFRRLEVTVRSADAIVSMMGDMLDWALEKAGRGISRMDRVFHLGASKPVQCDPSLFSGRFRALLSRLEGRFVVTFIGTFGRNTDPMVIARAARLASRNRGRFGDCVFVLAGVGNSYEQVKAEASGLDNVFLPGWIDDHEIAALVAVSDAGVIPCRDAFPNKAFTYMSGGLPLISSASGELSALVDGNRIGLNYEPDDPQELLDCVEQLYEDRALREEMAANSRNLFDRHYDSDVIYDAYAAHIETVAAEAKTGGRITAGCSEGWTA